MKTTIFLSLERFLESDFCWFPGAYLYTQNAKDDEEGAADEDNVADGFEGGDEGLHHQLQAWSSTDHSEQRKAGETQTHVSLFFT